MMGVRLGRNSLSQISEPLRPHPWHVSATANTRTSDPFPAAMRQASNRGDNSRLLCGGIVAGQVWRKEEELFKLHPHNCVSSHAAIRREVVAVLRRSKKHYRDRAEELRTAAESMQDEPARECLLDLARQYDEMAAKVQEGKTEAANPSA